MSNLTAGQTIEHFHYGPGVIVKRDVKRTTIYFDTHGIKILVTSLLAMEHAEGLPAKRRRAERVKAVKTAATLPHPVLVSGTL